MTCTCKNFRRRAPDGVHREDGDGASRRHEFSSRRISWRTVDPPNPSDSPKNDDDKVAKSTDLEREKEEDEDTYPHLHWPTTSRRDSTEIKGVERRSFTLEVSRGKGGRRFRFQPRSRERNAPRVNEPLRHSCRMPQVDRATKRHPPAGRRVLPLSDDGDHPTASRLQFRRVNADTDHRYRAVKLMDSEGNSSRDLTGSINSRTSRRKPEELSRDSLLSPRAQRSTLESRRGGRVAVKRNVFPRAETTGSTWKRRSRRSAEEEGSRSGRYGSLVPVAMRAFRRSGLGRTEERTLYGEWGEFLASNSGKSARRNEQVVRAAKSAISSLSLEEFTKNDYGGGGESTGRSIRDSRSNALRYRQSLQRPSSFAATVRSIIVGVFKTLGMFVQVGRQIMDVVESNTALACTKEYLWVKIINWIDA